MPSWREYNQNVYVVEIGLRVILAESELTNKRINMRYRQLSGRNFNISVRQLFACEKRSE